MNIENLRRACNQTGKIKEYVELAIRIQQVPVTEDSTKDLAEILDMIWKRADHLYTQLEKGIAIEVEWDNIEESEKDNGILDIAPTNE